MEAPLSAGKRITPARSAAVRHDPPGVADGIGAGDGDGLGAAAGRAGAPHPATSSTANRSSDRRSIQGIVTVAVRQG